MPQEPTEDVSVDFMMGFAVCAVVVIIIMRVFRNPGDYPPSYRDYHRDTVYTTGDYPEPRQPGRVVMVMIFAAFIIAFIAVLST